MRKGSKKLIMWIYQKILKIRSSVSSSVILMLEINLIRKQKKKSNRKNVIKINEIQIVSIGSYDLYRNMKRKLLEKLRIICQTLIKYRV